MKRDRECQTALVKPMNNEKGSLNSSFRQGRVADADAQRGADENGGDRSKAGRCERKIFCSKQVEARYKNEYYGKIQHNEDIFMSASSTVLCMVSDRGELFII